jgi:Spy/CpxP family protein refolding chaperone
MAVSKLILSTLAALMLGATPTKASADEPRDPFEGMWNPKQLLRGAMLTEAQVGQIRALRKTQFQHEKELKAKQRALWDEFDEKFTGTSAIDTAQLAALAKAAEQLHDQGEAEKLAIMFQMRALLTADQLRRVSETHQKTKALNDQLKAFEPTVASESSQ